MPGIEREWIDHLVHVAEAAKAAWPGLSVILATGYTELPEGSERLIDGRLGEPFRKEALAALLNGLAKG